MKPDPETVRKLIAQENEMINHRMTWFLVLQGFMLVGYSFAWEKSLALCVVFSCIGTVSALSVGILLRYGILALKNLEESCREQAEPVLGRGYDETPKFIHFLLPWHPMQTPRLPRTGGTTTKPRSAPTRCPIRSSPKMAPA